VREKLLCPRRIGELQGTKQETAGFQVRLRLYSHEYNN
jgi:hypothetical protein